MAEDWFSGDVQLKVRSSVILSPAYRAMPKGSELYVRLLMVRYAMGVEANAQIRAPQSQLVKAGLAKARIYDSILVLSALGLVKFHQKTTAGGGFKETLHELPFYPVNGAPETDEWRRFKTLKEAKQAVAVARDNGNRKQD